ncbi:MAG: cell envelope integrity EipB family protein [Sneathiella sp.]
MRCKNFILAVIGIGALGLVGPAMAAPLQLASHQAVYDLRLDKLGENSGIEAVRGRIVMKVEQQCDGLIVNQRMVLEMVNFEGNVIVSDYNQSTWEDNAGRMMRFDMSNMLNGQVIEKYSGVAEHREKGTIVEFSEPDQDDMELPDGVIFPGEHTRQVMKAAAAGRSLLSAKVYDGNGEDGLSDTLAVIGKAQTLLSPPAEVEALKGRTFWPLQISFFDLSQQQTEPDYKVSMKIFGNGIATDLHLEYSDFSLRGRVSDLTILDTEKCS